jgi:hypothetical protein
MITLVSDWDQKKIDDAISAFNIGGRVWLNYKKEYFDYFFQIKKKWQATSNLKNKSHFEFRSLFNQK